MIAPISVMRPYARGVTATRIAAAVKCLNRPCTLSAKIELAIVGTKKRTVIATTPIAIRVTATTAHHVAKVRPTRSMVRAACWSCCQAKKIAALWLLAFYFSDRDADESFIAALSLASVALKYSSRSRLKRS